MLLLLPFWLALFAILVGWGLLAQAAIRRASRDAIRGALTTFQTMWLGYAALLLMLIVYSLFLPITRMTIPFAVIPAMGGFWWQRVIVLDRVRALLARPRIVGVVAAVGVLTWLVVAYAAFDRVTWNDTNLYHLQVLKWNVTYPAVPGLANLHDRFGYDNSVHIFAAFVDAFWEGVAVHAMNGFFMAAILGQWIVECFSSRTPRTRLRQTFCLLTLPFLLGRLWTTEIASLSTDLPLALFGLVIVLELISLPRTSRERVLSPLFVMMMLASTAVTTKLGGLALFAACGAATVMLVGRRVPLRTWLPLLGPPALLLVVWAIRNVIVSGWLMFPVFGRLPLSWSVSAADGANHWRWIQSWARMPQQSPDAVLDHGFAHWFFPWMDGFRQSREMMLLAISGALLAFRVAHGPGNSAVRRAGEWTAFAACTLGIVQWFYGAPDLRFGAFWFWILPVVLFAPMVAGAMREGTPRALVIALSLLGCAWSGGFTPRLNAVIPKLWGRPPAPMKAKVVWVDAGPNTHVSTPAPPETEAGKPPKPTDDSCGDAALPCTPYPGLGVFRVPGDVGAGFVPQNR